MRRLLADGAQVVIADREAEANCTVLNTLSLDHSRYTYVVCDVAGPADTERLVATAIARFGGIDICICSAGMAEPPTPFCDLKLEEFDRVLAVNLRGPFLLGQAVARHMLATGRQGSITHISSVGRHAGGS